MRPWIRILSASIALMLSANLFATEGLTIEQMRRDLVKLDQSITTTKSKIATVKDAVFLPELYFVLAEFLVQKSRYQLALKIAENPKVNPDTLDYTAERRPKFEAIQVYDNIIEKFPKLEGRDRAFFYKAHEWRELGRSEEMVSTYQRLIKEYPKSSYRSESHIILGDFFFDQKKEFTLALEQYSQVLALATNPFTALAHYKIGWVRINQNKFPEALVSFENALKVSQVQGVDDLPETYKKTDIRREALYALVWPYSELTKADFNKLGSGRQQTMPYFRALAPDLYAYQRVLTRLGRRLFIKQNFVEAAKAYFEALRLSTEIKDRLELSEALYVSMRNSRQDWPLRGLVDEVAKTLIQVNTHPSLDAATRKKAWNDLEIFARDVATRQNRRAKLTRNPSDWRFAVADYRTYLELFPNHKYTRAMRLNLAESLFHLKDYVAAGKEYELLISGAKTQQQKKSYVDSSLQSFIQAVRNQSQLSKLELTEARYGLRGVGTQFFKSYPQDPARPEILFNLGQSYYDERLFPQAIAHFKRYIEMFPGGPQLRMAVHLILDAHNQREDFNQLITDGRKFLADDRIRDPALKSQIQPIVEQAELKIVQAKAGDFSQPDYASQMLKLARKYKGSNLGDQALYEAFVALKSKNDLKAYEPGEQLLLQHRSSKYAQEVVAAMGQMALNSADFRRAAIYFEIFFERYSQLPEARTLLTQAAEIRRVLADYSLAAQNYIRLEDFTMASQMYMNSGQWTELLRVAPRASGIYSPYFEGLALYRLKGIAAARSLLEKATQLASEAAQEKEMAAHARYLLAMSALDDFKAIRMRPGAESKAVADKAALLKQLESQLKDVIRFGDGRWTIAALSGLGQASLEFSRFILDAPIPKGLSKADVTSYRAALKQQAAPYEKQARMYFVSCSENANKFEILTRFVLSCQSFGRVTVDESKENVLATRAKDSSPKTALAIRQKLLLKPNDTQLLSTLATEYLKVGDLSMVEMIYSRSLELSPNDPRILNQLGDIKMRQMDYPQANVWYKKAYLQSKKSPEVAKNLLKLYQKFQLTTKVRQIKSSHPQLQ